MSLLLLILLVLAVATTQALAGGRQIALCLPGYALLAIAAVLSWWPRRRTPIPRGATECLVAAVLFFSYVCIRSIFSPEPYLARTDLYTALAGMAVYLLVALNITSTRWRMALAGAVLALAFVNCGIGAIQFFKNEQFMLFSFLPRPGYGNRASGFYGYPNHLSGFLEMALMMGLSITFWSRWPSWAKVLSGYASAVFVLGIVATGSRGGYISTVAGLVVFVLLSLVLVGKLASGRLIVVFLAGLMLLGGVGWGVRQAMSQSFFLESRAEKMFTMDISRMLHWQAAWKQFHLSPVVGTGSGTYLYYGRLLRNPEVHTDPVHAHNDYLELLAEYGILGIIAAAIFLQAHLRRGWNWMTQRLRDDANYHGIGSNSLALTAGALSAAAACLTHCVLDFNLHMPANLLTAALIFGLLATPGESPKAATTAESAGWPAFLRLALPALGILIVVRVMPTAPAEYYAERSRTILADGQRPISPDLNQKMEGFARRGLEWDPRNPELYAAIAEAQSAQGDLEADPSAKAKFYEQTVAYYRKALEFAPGEVGYLLGLVSALDAVERFGEADPFLQRALQLDPNNGITHTVTANHLLMQGKLPEAAAEYQRGFELGAWEGGQAGLHYIEQQLKEKKGGSTAPESSPPPTPEKAR
ncbi:MAG TPA: O-antigen ligase family protein [Chthoniobacter sp.]|nr:O-antigen ligase family protein [Chthoniobacter sp.]